MHLEDYKTVNYRTFGRITEEKMTGPIKPRFAWLRKDKERRPVARYRMVPVWAQPLALASMLCIGFTLGIIWTVTPAVCIFLACILTSTLIMSLQAKER